MVGSTIGLCGPYNYCPPIPNQRKKTTTIHDHPISLFQVFGALCSGVALHEQQRAWLWSSQDPIFLDVSCWGAWPPIQLSFGSSMPPKTRALEGTTSISISYICLQSTGALQEPSAWLWSSSRTSLWEPEVSASSAISSALRPLDVSCRGSALAWSRRCTTSPQDQYIHVHTCLFVYTCVYIYIHMDIYASCVYAYTLIHTYVWVYT